MTTSWDTNYVYDPASILEFSNNDRTVRWTDNDAATVGVSNPIRIRDALGSTHYIEFEITDYNQQSTTDVSVFNFGFHTENSLPINGLDSTPVQVGETSWGMQASGNSGTSMIQRTTYTTDNYGVHATKERNLDIEQGDVIGMLVRFGVSVRRPFHVGLDMYLNGDCVGSSLMLGVGMGDFSNRVLRPTVDIAPLFNEFPLEITIRQQSEWEYEPAVIPSVQAWTGSVSVPTVQDNGYCKLEHSGITQDVTVTGAAFAALSNNDLTARSVASRSGSQASNPMLSGTTARNSGKYYFEYTIDETLPETPASLLGHYFGLECGQRSSTVTGSDSNWILYRTGQTTGTGDDFTSSWTGGASSGFPVIGGDLPAYRPSSGDVYGIAVELSTDINDTGNAIKMWLRHNGVWTNNDPGVTSTADFSPSTSANGFANGQAFRPVILFRMNQNQAQTAIQVTANFGATAFAHAIPSGFTAWDDTEIPS